MKHSEDWPSAWTAQIGQAVRAARKAQSLSAQALSDICGELGVDLPRNTIVNLENGRKSSLPVHEAIALAAALGLAPAELLAPIGHVGEIQYLPAEEPEDPFLVLEWIAGNAILLRKRPGGLAWDWEGSSAGLVSAWRFHNRLVGEWRDRTDQLEDIRSEMALIDAGQQTSAEFFQLEDVSPDEWKARERATMRRLDQIPTLLAKVRRSIATDGVSLPPVPDELLAQIEKAADGEHPEA